MQEPFIGGGYIYSGQGTGRSLKATPSYLAGTPSPITSVITVQPSRLTGCNRLRCGPLYLIHTALRAYRILAGLEMLEVLLQFLSVAKRCRSQYAHDLIRITVIRGRSASQVPPNPPEIISLPWNVHQGSRIRQAQNRQGGGSSGVGAGWLAGWQPNVYFKTAARLVKAAWCLQSTNNSTM